MNEQQINERISIKHTDAPRIALMVLFPLQCFGVAIFLFYLTFHWRQFIGQSATLIAWIGWFIGLVLYVLLAALAVKVLRAGIEAILAFGRGAAEIYHRMIEARNTRARRELLHTDANYVVYLERGKIVVQNVVQERYSYSIRGERQEQLPAGEHIEQLPAPVLTFRELLEAGIVQAAIREGRMILGYTAGQLRYGSWLDLYSCGIGGVTGAGKTTTVRFLLFQALLAYARFLMIDPHIGQPDESLAAQFQAFKNIHILPPCDDTPREVERRLNWLKHEYTRREKQGIKGPPVVFIVDEFNEIVRRLPDELRKELADLLLNIAQGGRKFGLFAMLIGQRWSEQDLGGKNYGAAIRSSLASTLAHRFTDEDQARKLVGSKYGPRCLELAQGHYYFRDTSGNLCEMITPLTVADDGVYIQQLLTSGATSGPDFPTSVLASRAYDEPVSLRPGPRPLHLLDAAPDVETDATTAEHEPLSYQAEQVLALLKQRKGQNEIIEQVWGVKSTDGRPYRAAVEEYRTILASLVGRIGA